MDTHNLSFALMTVPHTGATFTSNLLALAGEVPMHYHWKGYGTWLPGVPLLITVRDPYLSAIRFIYSNQSIESCAEMWNESIDALPFVDHFLYDVGCREEDRITHTADMFEFCQRTMTPEIEKYVSEWKPLNTSENYDGDLTVKDFKANYLKDGSLPDGYNWSLLDDAVAWYKGLPTNDYV